MKYMWHRRIELRGTQNIISALSGIIACNNNNMCNPCLHLGLCMLLVEHCWQAGECTKLEARISMYISRHKHVKKNRPFRRLGGLTSLTNYCCMP